MNNLFDRRSQLLINGPIALICINRFCCLCWYGSRFEPLNNIQTNSFYTIRSATYKPSRPVIVDLVWSCEHLLSSHYCYY